MRWRLNIASKAELRKVLNLHVGRGLLSLLDVLGLDGLLLGEASVSVDERLVSCDHLLPVLVGSDDGRLPVEEIDLLERESLGLGDEEVGEGNAESAGSSPEEEYFDSEVGSLR